MTLPVPGTLTYSYNADGVTTVFSYPVRFLEAGELLVIREDAAGAQTVQIYNTDYTVSGAGNPSGGSITFLSVPVGGKVIITRQTAAKQLVDLEDSQRNPAEAVELQLDRLAMVDQDQGRDIGRSLKLAVGAPALPEGHFPEAAADGSMRDGGSSVDIKNAQANAEQTAADRIAAAASAAAAAAAAAGVNLPSAVADSILVQKHDVSGYEAVPLGVDGGKKLVNRVKSEFNLWDYMDNAPGTVGEINAAFAKMQAEMTRASTVHIPQGVYQANDSIPLRTNINLEIYCDSGVSTVVLGTAGLTGKDMFKPADTNPMNFLRWRGGYFSGAGFANRIFGFNTGYCAHYVFEDIALTQCTVAGMSVIGYNGRVRGEAFENTGDGFQFAGVGPAGTDYNNNLVLDVVSYANNRLGVYAANGLGIDMSGSGIEGNKSGGVMVHDFDNFTWQGGYNERNGETGWVYSVAAGSPEALTVNADVHLLRGGRQIYSNNSRGVRSAVIEGVLFEGGFVDEGPNNFPVFGNSLEGLSVRSCNTRGPRYKAMVGAYNGSQFTKIEAATVEGNTRSLSLNARAAPLKPLGLIGTAFPSYVLSSAHEVSNRFEKDANNYAAQLLTDYTAQAGTTGTFVSDPSKYGKFPVMVMTPGDKIWGRVLDLAANPQLQGKTVWFGAAYRVGAANCGVRFYCNGATDADLDAEGSTGGEWRMKSVVATLPASGTFVYGFQMKGATGFTFIACPMLAVVGNDWANVMRAT